MSSLVANEISAMLAYWDNELVCRYANDAYMEWFGKAKEEMIDKITLDKLLGPDLYEKNKPHIAEALKGNKQVFEREIPTVDGKGSRHSLATYSPHVVDGKVKGFFVHVADVSYVKQLEAMLSKLRLDMLRDVIEAQEAERAYIAALLRDSVNQTLTHCKLLLQVKDNNISEDFTSKKLEQGIDRAIRELNMLSVNLIPSAIEDFGFIAGTKVYIETNMSDVPVKFICRNTAIEALGLHVKLSLFRIIQSFLSLVTEQKTKSAIRLNIECDNKQIVMQLSILQADFKFQNGSKQFMDITRRVEYHGGHMHELVNNNEKILMIKISI